MKTTALVTSIALFATAFCITAFAQTGRPADLETDGASATTESAPIDVTHAAVGSYARYLMLNGATRDEAIQEAQSIDHPAPSKHFALHTVRPKAGAATTSQQ